MIEKNPFQGGQYQAVLFDLDGVLTATAKVHAAAWKKMFDEFLKARAQGRPFEPFDTETDYRLYVDGKPRYDGVRSFLEARGIELPAGNPQDAPGMATVCALGNLKDQLVNAVLDTEGVEVFPGSAAWVRQLRQSGIRTGVVSSSVNCQRVLQAGGIEDQFDVRVDGAVAAELGMPGKPNPDMFLAAARELGVPPERAVVVEDAISGVQAGKAGGFGLVIGVARAGEAEALRRAGADLVVADLAELVQPVPPGSERHT